MITTNAQQPQLCYTVPNKNTARRRVQAVKKSVIVEQYQCSSNTDALPRESRQSAMITIPPSAQNFNSSHKPLQFVTFHREEVKQ